MFEPVAAYKAFLWLGGVTLLLGWYSLAGQYKALIQVRVNIIRRPRLIRENVRIRMIADLFGGRTI